MDLRKTRKTNKSGSGTISWAKSGGEGGGKKATVEETDAGQATVPPPMAGDVGKDPPQRNEDVSKQKSPEDKGGGESQVEKETVDVKEVVKEKKETVDKKQESSASLVAPAELEKAPPLPSDAPPPPPPPEEDEKPPLPPVPSLPLFVPPSSVNQGDSKPASENSSTPVDRSADKSQSGSPQKPSVSPISLGSSPTPYTRPLSMQTAAIATPVLPQEPLQPREHKPRCIDAFEIIDQIGEGTYGKVGLHTVVCVCVSVCVCVCVCVSERV